MFYLNKKDLCKLLNKSLHLSKCHEAGCVSMEIIIRDSDNNNMLDQVTIDDNLIRAVLHALVDSAVKD